jgi:hypothetical protein
MFQYYPHQAIAMEQETDLISDFPEGPLSIYRKQASFDWKKLKLVFDKPDILKLKVSTVCTYFLISIWYRTLLIRVTVNHRMEKFTIVTDSKGHLQHYRIPVVCLIISHCNALSIVTVYSCEMHFNIHPPTPRFVK